MTKKARRAKVDFKAVASELWITKKLDVQKHGLVYRENKDDRDVIVAMRKAGKNGLQKTEFEISMLAAYLQGIFKAA